MDSKGAGDRVNEDEGKTKEQLRREDRDLDVRASAQVLEILGDIRDVDEKPPDTVLFVCKLNPITTDEDLKIIFSSFGTIKKCEIVRDRRTQASLQYAFIEYETPEQCEKAYLKMDGSMIDNRRIRVDFSQSVAKNRR